MIRLKDILLTEQLKQSHITLLKRLYSAYGSNRKSKTTLEKLHKVLTKLPFSDIFKLMKITPGPYYRGMELDDVPEVGNTFKFGFGGWTPDESVAARFAVSTKKIGVVFTTNTNKHVFLDMNNFGEAIRQYIKKEYPDVDWDLRDISNKPRELSSLYTYAKGLYKFEKEVIFEPFTAKVKNVEEVLRVGGKRLLIPIYKVEV